MLLCILSFTLNIKQKENKKPEEENGKIALAPVPI
jgi:hypothetical protein